MKGLRSSVRPLPAGGRALSHNVAGIVSTFFFLLLFTALASLEKPVVHYYFLYIKQLTLLSSPPASPLKMGFLGKNGVATKVESDDGEYGATSASQKMSNSLDQKDMDRMGKKQEMNVNFPFPDAGYVL